MTFGGRFIPKKLILEEQAAQVEWGTGGRNDQASLYGTKVPAD